MSAFINASFVYVEFRVYVQSLLYNPMFVCSIKEMNQQIAQSFYRVNVENRRNVASCLFDSGNGQHQRK
jgi:hypothetical protein